VEIALGFVIALTIALTGVGAGSLTTPLLLLLTTVTPAKGVGTALAFGFLVKSISTPVYLARRQIDYRVLGFLLAGGLPGVIGGALLLNHVDKGEGQAILHIAIGLIIAATAIFHLWRMFRPRPNSSGRDRAKYLPFFSLPIGFEVGFSSAGAGALGSLLLLGMTRLTAAEVVGTDLCFGLVISFVGGGFQLSVGNYDPHLLLLLAIGGVAGAVVGSILAGHVAQRPLRVGLLMMLILLGGQLSLRGYEDSHPRPLAAERSAVVLPSSAR
jgi:uncharacterized membrane protein YfcA